MAKAREGKRRARPGGHRLRPEVIAHHQRQRILGGAAKAISEQGYRSTSVADIVKAAAITRPRFYENFGSKEDCFFELYDNATEAALATVAKACEQAEGSFPERVEIAIAALLDQLAADPPLARAVVVEGPAVGPAINERFERVIGQFAMLLRQGRPGVAGTALPETVEETVVGGLYWLLYYALLDERPKRIQKLLPQLTEFSLIPFAGADAAPTASAST